MLRLQRVTRHGPNHWAMLSQQQRAFSRSGLLWIETKNGSRSSSSSDDRPWSSDDETDADFVHTQPSRERGMFQLPGLAIDGSSAGSTSTMTPPHFVPAASVSATAQSLAAYSTPSSPPRGRHSATAPAGSESPNAPKPSTKQHKPHFYDTAVGNYADRKARRFTVQRLIKFGAVMDDAKILDGGRYVQSELPVRLSLRLQDLQNLPFVVGINPYISEIYKLYQTSFDEMRLFRKIKTIEDNDRFCNLVADQIRRHGPVVSYLARATPDLLEHMPRDAFNTFMERMLSTRVSRRVLAEQHITLSNEYMHRVKHPAGWVGIVNCHCKPADIVKDCSQQLQECFGKTLGYGDRVPEVKINGDVHMDFAYIEMHFRQIVMEILSNAMRHSVQHWKDSDVGTVPPVLVTVSEGVDEIILRFRDQGGGFPPDHLGQIWDYDYTTADREEHDKLAADISERANMIMAGHGFGLASARVYARYLGGSLSVQSMHGYGTDVFVRFSRSGNVLEKVVDK
eukprot:Clim_evm1s144 gene=Clim_evmTU1s144